MRIINITTILLFVCSSVFAQRIEFSKLSNDEANFINFVLKDTINYNKYNEDSIRIGYWVTFDSLNQVSSILYYNPIESKYVKTGEILQVDKRSIIYNNTNSKIKILYDNIYSKDISISISEDIRYIKACSDTSIFFKLKNQTIMVFDDTATFYNTNINDCKQEYKKTDLDDITIYKTGTLCQDTKYNDMIININDNKVIFKNLLNVIYFKIKNDLFIFSYQTCKSRLRIYKLSPY